jgi:hypothetical protein
MPPDVADVAEIAKERADDRFRLTAVGAFEVAVLDKGDRRLERPANVVPRVELLRRGCSNAMKASGADPAQRAARTL